MPATAYKKIKKRLDILFLLVMLSTEQLVDIKIV